MVYKSDMEDYRRRYGLEPLVRSIEDEELLKGRQRATVRCLVGSFMPSVPPPVDGTVVGGVCLASRVSPRPDHATPPHSWRNLAGRSSLPPHQVDEPCPKCKHPQMEYYTMQLRSADEGQTVFYECPKCKHKYSQNT